MRLSKLTTRLFIIQALVAAVLAAALPAWSAERCVYKFDNVVVLFDRSGSMLENQPGTEMEKFTYARTIAVGIADGIPKADEGDLSMGLKVFGYYLEDEPLKTRTIVARQKLDRSALSSALKGLTPAKDVFGFLTPLARSLRSLQEEGAQWSGRTAVFVISDGCDTVFGHPVKAAQELKQAKKDVTLYTIIMGDSKKGRQVMQEIAAAGGGKLYEASEFYDSAKRSAALREIFLDCKPVAEKPVPPAVQPAVQPVPPKAGLTNDMFPVVLFDYDHASIKASEKPKLEKVGNLLKDNPTVKVTVEGHTDAIGTDSYNQSLSERRANGVKDYLNKLYGIVKERMDTVGFGKTKPAAPNDTKENRTKNRRVEFKIKEQ